MDEPKIRFEKYKEPLTSRLIGDIYTERKESGDETLPILTVSIHSGVSDGALDDEDLGKRVQRSEDKTKYKRAEKDDVVFNMMRAWQGAIGVVRTTGMVSPAYIVAKPDDSVYPLFMDYYLKSPQMIKTINKLSYGLMDFRKRLYWDSFASINCMLPSLEEQKDICELLERIEHVIIHNENELKKWIDLKKGMLNKMFPSKGALIPETRFPGFTEKWKQQKFEDFTWLSGRRNKENLDLEPFAITNEHGFIPQSEAHNEFGYMKDTDRTAYIIVAPNSFAYNPARINVGSIGYYEGTEKVIVSSLYEVFQTSGDVYDRFLWHWFKTQVFQSWIERLQEGSVRLYFYYDKLRECSIAVPDMEEQKAIAEYFDKLDNLISIHKLELDKWKELKKGLLQQLFV